MRKPILALVTLLGLVAHADAQSCFQTGCTAGFTCLSCTDGEQVCASNAGDLSRGCSEACGISHYCYANAQCIDPSSGTCAGRQTCGAATCTAGSTCLSCTDGEQVCASNAGDLSRGCSETCGSDRYCYNGAQCSDPASGTCSPFELSIVLKATIKETTYAAGGGKIVKLARNNKSIVQGVTSSPGAQVVGLFDPEALRVTGLEVVDRCGQLLSKLATISLAPGATCQDTGRGAKQELVCPLEISFANGGSASVVSDTKLSYDGSGRLKSTAATLTGVGLEISGSPLQVTAVITGGFKYAKGCP